MTTEQLKQGNFLLNKISDAEREIKALKEALKENEIRPACMLVLNGVSYFVSEDLSRVFIEKLMDEKISIFNRFKEDFKNL